METLLLLFASALLRSWRPWVPGLLALFIATSLTLPALAQDHDSTEYELYAGGSYLRASSTSSGNAYGWHTSISQYPYRARWIGGAIEGSGLFLSQDVKAQSVTLHESLYTCMAGPSFAFPTFHRVRPFGHALAGAVVIRVSATGAGSSIYGSTATTSNQTVLGAAVGGGADVPLKHRLAARGTVDWLTFKQDSADRLNNLRVSGGVVLKF